MTFFCNFSSPNRFVAFLIAILKPFNEANRLGCSNFRLPRSRESSYFHKMTTV